MQSKQPLDEARAAELNNLQAELEKLDCGLFVDFACIPQTFAWPSWHAPEADPLRFGAEAGQGPLTVLKFKWERVATEDEAQVGVDQLVSLCEQEGWALAPIADFKSLGLAEEAASMAVAAAAAVAPAVKEREAAREAAATAMAAAREARGWWEAARAMATAREAEQEAERKAAAAKRALAKKAATELRAAEAKEVAVLYHQRYVSGAYRFDKGASAEGYVRFRTAGDAEKARRHPELVRMCRGKEPKKMELFHMCGKATAKAMELYHMCGKATAKAKTRSEPNEPTLMGERVFENELKFKRGLSVMGSLYASATGTCVLQLTDPPGELGGEAAPDELVSERTGTVFVVRTDKSLEELGKELGDDMLSCEKGPWGVTVVRVDGERAARAARLQDEGGYPLHRKDRVVYPMYNLRPYRSRGWPTFETSAASIMLAHLTQCKRRGLALPPHVAKAEESGPKLINIDLIGVRKEVKVEQSPERLLRECKVQLRSKRIFFTGGADRKHVVQLLSDFEDSIAVEFDQKRAKHLNLWAEDLEHALTAELREARRARFHKLLQSLTFHEEPMPILRGHVEDEPTHTSYAKAAVPTKDPLCKSARLSATPSLFLLPQKLPAPQHYPISSRVFVTRNNGAETLAYVKAYDAEQQIYTVELEKLGSMRLEACDEKSLRTANLFDVVVVSARAIIHSFQTDDSRLEA
jgi:hypothetical protein